MVRVLFKAKIGDLEEEVREVCSRIIRKYLIGVIQGMSGKKRLLARFWYGCKKYLYSNQRTIVRVENIPVENEPEVPKNNEIPEEQVALEKG